MANVEAAPEELRAGSLPAPLDEWRAETGPARDRGAFDPDRIPNATALPKGLSALARRRHARVLSSPWSTRRTRRIGESAMPEATAFDTLAAARELEDAGVARNHAAAIASIARRAAAADRGTLSTKADISGVETKIAELETRIYRALRLQAAGLVAIMVGLEIFG